jgi:hypothetical protein
MAITLGGTIPLPRGSAPSLTVTDPLTIYDPIELSSNVGRNCFRFGQVQLVMRDALAALNQVAAETAWGEETLSLPTPPPPPGGAGSSPRELLPGTASQPLPSTPPPMHPREFPILSAIIPSLTQLESGSRR